MYSYPLFFLLFYRFLFFHHQRSPIKGLLSLLYSALALPEKASVEAPELYNCSIQISWWAEDGVSLEQSSTPLTTFLG